MKKLTLLLLAFSNPLWANEWSGNISIDYQLFSKEGLATEQSKSNTSASFQAEWFHDWDGGNQSVTFVPFVRVDQNDEERSHYDVRELFWLSVFEESELRVGLAKVFWGVSESQHLVDVINQTDSVENADGEDKFGQAMINYSLVKDWGTMDLFVLPNFRERTFAGVNGRLRSNPHVDTTKPIYEHNDNKNHIDYAARWSHSVGDWDVGLSYFNGTSRDPNFVVASNGNNQVVLRPVYNILKQVGLDLQATKEAWLWKLEAVNREINNETYNAATVGFEYTFNGIFETSSDVGLVMEYLYDDRNELSTTPFADDIMTGLRWTMNDESDTSLLLGVISDRSDDSRLYSLEANRRVAENMKLSIEARIFAGLTDTNSPLYSLRQDDFIQLEVSYYF